MALGTFVLFVLPLLSQAVVVWVHSALYRHHNSLVSYANFACDLNHQLAGTKIASFMVEDRLDCTFKCIGKDNCFSFNLAVHPDSEGFYMCDLLAADKYRASSNEFQSNAGFHHCSPWVNNTVLFCVFLTSCYLFSRTVIDGIISTSFP